MKVMIPVSVGELFDKITILEIKLNNITDEAKLKNIKNEFDSLTEIALNIDPFYKGKDLYNTLLKINQELWGIEDGKRSHEAVKNFGDKFIYLARQVYIQNDKRASVKRSINELYGSEIIEEKSYKSY